MRGTGREKRERDVLRGAHERRRSLAAAVSAAAAIRSWDQPLYTLCIVYRHSSRRALPLKCTSYPYFRIFQGCLLAMRRLSPHLRSGGLWAKAYGMQ